MSKQRLKGFFRTVRNTTIGNRVSDWEGNLKRLFRIWITFQVNAQRRERGSIE